MVSVTHGKRGDDFDQFVTIPEFTVFAYRWVAIFLPGTRKYGI